MTDEIKIILALQQIGNISSLIKDNEYEKYLSYHLIITETELKRQLTNLCSSSKLKESNTN
jgi:hypothetical protein